MCVPTPVTTCTLCSDSMCDEASTDQTQATRQWHPEATVALAYSARFRTAADRAHVGTVFARVFGVPIPEPPPPRLLVTPDSVVVGEALLPRSVIGGAGPSGANTSLPVLHGLARPLERVALCVELAWPCMLVGPSSSGEWCSRRVQPSTPFGCLCRRVRAVCAVGGPCVHLSAGQRQVGCSQGCDVLAPLAVIAAAGKTACLRLLASLVNRPLREITLSTSADSTDLLGCFEQVKT
jgi:midasin (ATPase involved in ribosome maturation)